MSCQTGVNQERNDVSECGDSSWLPTFHSCFNLIGAQRVNVPEALADVGVARGGWPWAKAETSRHCLMSGV